MLALLLAQLCFSSPDLTQHNAERARLEERGMATLIGWAGLNIGTGAAGWALAVTTEGRAFHQMNLGWGLINGAIGAIGLINARREDAAEFDMNGTWRADASLQKALLLNTGLDVAYVAAGAWMLERGIRLDQPRLRGFGRSLLVQGGFLFAFDLTLAALADRHHRRLHVRPFGTGLLVEGTFR